MDSGGGATTTTYAGRPGGEKRGNSHDRAARKRWMLAQPVWHGTGTECECVHCGSLLTFATVEADRIVPGGSYARSNVQPSCRPCNAARSNRLDWVSPRLAAAAA
jgi:5-methylcytosine-specific restriction endonuclease McrA